METLLPGNALPRFRWPPLAEAVMSVHFRDVDLSTAALSTFWMESLKDEYPTPSDAPPYLPEIERFGVPNFAGVQAQLNVGLPPFRMWFANDDSVVQLQRDWLALNWRRDDTTLPYIPYQSRRDRFERILSDFIAFAGLAPKSFPAVQVEVAYINLVELGQEDLERGPFGALLEGIAVPRHSYLGASEGGQLMWSYLSDPEKDVQGRLRITAERVNDPARPNLVQLALTMRGRPKTHGVTATLETLDYGHAWVVQGFKDVTSPLMWERWGLTTGSNDDNR